jgi:hypothetical protein
MQFCLERDAVLKALKKNENKLTRKGYRQYRKNTVFLLSFLRAKV